MGLSNNMSNSHPALMLDTTDILDIHQPITITIWPKSKGLMLHSSCSIKLKQTSHKSMNGHLRWPMASSTSISVRAKNGQKS